MRCRAPTQQKVAHVAERAVTDITKLERVEQGQAHVIWKMPMRKILESLYFDDLLPKSKRYTIVNAV